ncbi:hypothetical protein BSKO_04536 [Bryopsis sp. KO-2023]|nr:hypothetical protein BSKO_04536 [Bryopsis sp. KO-2023]
MVAFNRFLVALVCFLASPLAGVVEAGDGWRTGRATFYGIWWSIHTGSCGYGNIDYWQGTGWDVAAIPDSHYEYNWSCGKCYEVKCEPMNFKDNYGNHLERSNACHDSWKVVTVTIVDSCPCNYSGNSYSNKRWCCGDMDHFDLSYHTFDKLAPRHYGVIGLKYRPVACPSSYLENRHHLGRKLKEEQHGENKEGPQMVVLDERYERPEGVQGAMPAHTTDESQGFVGTLPSGFTEKEINPQHLVKLSYSVESLGVETPSLRNAGGEMVNQNPRAPFTTGKSDMMNRNPREQQSSQDRMGGVVKPKMISSLI